MTSPRCGAMRRPAHSDGVSSAGKFLPQRDKIEHAVPAVLPASMGSAIQTEVLDQSLGEHFLMVALVDLDHPGVHCVAFRLKSDSSASHSSQTHEARTGKGLAEAAQFSEDKRQQAAIWGLEELTLMICSQELVTQLEGSVGG